MGVVALVILSVTAAWTFVVGGMQAPDGSFYQPSLPVRTYWFEVGRAITRLRSDQPPDRKSVIVDTSGVAHSTADLTQSTKRDRSRPYVKLKIQPVPAETAAMTPPPTIKTEVGRPLFQMQVEEIPAPPPAPVKPVRPAPKAPAMMPELSLGRKVQAVLMADKNLSRSAQLTVRATSSKNRVTLRGIVLDKEEKDYIQKKAEVLAGTGNVDDRLTIL